ncbi:zinc-ribbon domain-containing protein [Myxococcota bacterium]|nr:zinc-ribbon domain-containing protein [Myxococcota bacterium]MBU1410921.1 zinc-ribbon domain-containing protein [Myxococcota bacterium]MBU1509438.1 zinc-ribbon domain-containing protein [Myxococcota bacterium]
MDIRCNQCGSEYFLNDSQIPPDGIRVKCETCQNIFFVSPYGDEEPPDDLNDADDEEPAKEFMIRRRKGSMLRFTELETLHEWILDGTVGPQDEIGTNDENWAELSMVPELKEVFARVRPRGAVRRTSTTPMAQAREPATGPTRDVSVSQTREPSRISSSPARDVVFRNEEVEPELGGKSFRELDRDQKRTRESSPRTQRELDREPVITREVATGDDFEPVNRRARWPWVVGVIVLVVGGSLGGLFALGVLPSPFPGKSRGQLPPDPPQLSTEDQKMTEARKQMDVGTVAGYAAAVSVLQNCDKAPCREMKALSLALWAYVLNEDLEIFVSKLPPALSDEEKKARAKGLLNEVGVKARLAIEAARGVTEESAMQLAAMGIAQLMLNEPGANVTIEKSGLKDAKYPYFLFAKALYFQTAGDMRKAADIFEKTASTATPDNALIIFHFAHARAAIRMQDYARAGRALDHVCNQRPDHLVACQLAAEMVSKASATPPVDPNVPVTPDMDAAPMDPVVVTPGMTTEPDGMDMDMPGDDRGDFDYDTYYSKAEQYYKSGDKSRAKQYYLKASHKDPTSVDAFNGAAYCDLDTGNAAGAIPNFRRALALVPNFTRAQYGLAEALYQNGQKSDALAAFKRFLQLNPPGGHNVPRARMMVTQLEQELGISTPVPGMTEPEMTEPAMTEPEMTEPAMTEPEMTEPAMTEPEMTEPAMTEPEMTESPMDPPPAETP